MAALAICAVIFLANRNLRSRHLSVPALCVGLSTYLLVSSPNTGLSGSWVETVLVVFAGFVPILAIWAGVELFLDRPVYRLWHVVIALLVAAGGWLVPLLPWAATGRGVIVVLLYVALLYIALATAAGDLVEPRRRFRRWFVTLMALTGLVISLVELFKLDDNLPPLAFPLHAAAFLILTTLFLIWATRLEPDLWQVRDTAERSLPAQLSSADAAVLQRINAAMADGVWKLEGLTIAQLSTSVDAPEHRVRRAINKGLGYRNFAQFINERRIDAAREVLSDPSRSDTPVLSIAYDVGFASIGPFNRAFRGVTGQSPTEFRKAQESTRG